MLKFAGKIVGKKRDMRNLKWVMRATSSSVYDGDNLKVAHTTNGTIMATDAYRIHVIRRKDGVPIGDYVKEENGEYVADSLTIMQLDARKALRQATPGVLPMSVVLDVRFLKDALSCLGDSENVALITVGGASDPVRISIASKDGKSQRFALIMPMMRAEVGVDFWEPSVAEFAPNGSV